MPCPVNTYNDQMDAKSCTPCPEGQISRVGNRECKYENIILKKFRIYKML